jgi:hypothetical protein
MTRDGFAILLSESNGLLGIDLKLMAENFEILNTKL